MKPIFRCLVKRGQETIPQVKIAIGPSIGDQGVEYHTFYSVAPEAVGFVADKLERHLAAGINAQQEQSRSTFHKWSDGLGRRGGHLLRRWWQCPPEKPKASNTAPLHTSTSIKTAAPEKRYLITGLVPVLSDGSRTIIYAGPKDHYLLSDGSKDITAVVNRPIDLDGLIDYGFLGWLSRPIAVPILDAITYLYKLTGSYGVAIILFTIVIYSLFFPLKWRSSKAMKKAQKLAPKMKELQEKIKGLKQNDPD